MAGEVEGWAYGRDERARLRISDSDRHQVAEFLRKAAGEGRLEVEELEQRLEAAYAAKTYGELVPITADLPAYPASAPPLVAPSTAALATPYESSIAIMSTTNRTGLWQIGASHTAFVLMGGVKLDLREAQFTAPETHIQASGFWGGIDIYVNARTRVVVDGVAIMGTFGQSRDKVAPEIGPESPLVRVSGLALMSGVTVQRRAMPGESKRLRRR
jgi:hypothetical protein